MEITNLSHRIAVRLKQIDVYEVLKTIPGVEVFAFSSPGITLLIVFLL